MIEHFKLKSPPRHHAGKACYMRRLHSLPILMTTIFCLMQINAFAQVGPWQPGGMNYQGQLIQHDGTPVPQGSYALHVSIYDEMLTGTLVWGPFEFDGVTTGPGHAAKAFVGPNGRFNVVLGENDTSGRRLVDQMQVLENEKRFIELRVEDDAPLQPRQRFLSTPYVIQAATATQIADVITTDNLSFGIGIMPTALLDVNGDLRIRGSISASEVKANHLQVNDLAVSGTVTAGSMTINGDLEVNGTLSAAGFPQIQTTEYSLTYTDVSIGIRSEAVPGTNSDDWFCALSNVKITGQPDANRVGCQLDSSTGVWRLFVDRSKTNYNVVCTARCFKFR